MFSSVATYKNIDIIIVNDTDGAYCDCNMPVWSINSVILLTAINRCLQCADFTR